MYIPRVLQAHTLTRHVKDAIYNLMAGIDHTKGHNLSNVLCLLYIHLFSAVYSLIYQIGICIGNGRWSVMEWHQCLVKVMCLNNGS